jgi:hypothetical protein
MECGISSGVYQYQFVMLTPIRITLRVATWALHGRVSSDSASKQREAVAQLPKLLGSR